MKLFYFTFILILFQLALPAQNKSSSLINFLSENTNSDKVNDFILNSILGTEEYFLQSGYTAQQWSNSSWINTMRLSIQFNSFGNEESQLFENWNGSNWANDKKYETVYNQNNQIQTYTYFLYSGGQWQPQNKLEHSYDNSNVSSITKLNYQNSVWVFSSRDLYTYDANNNLVEKIIQSWTNNSWLNQTQSLFTYDVNNNLISALFTYWDNGVWVNNQKYIYNYNQLNNFTEYLYQKWISSSWVNQFRYTYTYNTNNLLDVYLKQNWSNNSWVNSDKSSYNYDQHGNRIQTFRELWNNNSWVSFQQTTYTYNDTLLIHYKLTEFNGSQWQNKNQTNLTYDSNGNKDTEIYQSWINNDWQNTNKFIYSHILITNTETDFVSPTHFKLEQNYPNPFNPSTKIKYVIPNGVRNLVTLKVYDILGNEVAALVDEYKPAGTYEINFDASKLSSGTYFYRLTVGEFTETKKLLLIK